MPDLNDIHAIGIATCNKHLFDTCIQWLELAKTIADSRIKLGVGRDRIFPRRDCFLRGYRSRQIEKNWGCRNVFREKTRIFKKSNNRDETGRDENLVSSRREIRRDYEVFKLYRATIGENRSNCYYFWPVLAN